MEAPAQRTKLLLVEDDPLDARLLHHRLALAAPSQFDVVHCDCLRAALERFGAGEQFDAVLLDLSLPDSAGLETFTSLHGAAPATPIVIMTGFDDQSTATHAVRNGAQDYLVKGGADGDSIRRSISHAIERARLLADLDSARRHQAELKDQFLSHVSHELRMPLTVIYQAMANLLSGAVGDINGEQRECLEIAMPNVNQLRKMIDDLLEATRLDNARLTIRVEPLDLEPFVSRIVDSVRPAATGNGLFLARSRAMAHGLIARADPSRIEQVLVNLLDNAIKFTPAGGRIAVVLAPDPDDPQWVRCSVTDSGCGVPAEARERIFERMHQESQPIESSRKGIGVGLFICRELIARHGGKIWVESAPVQGSTFHFTLPLQAKD
jgi:signal transduction histidine kinase